MSLKRSKKIAIIGLVAATLVACSDEDVDELCEVPLTIAGAPDLTAPPTFTNVGGAEIINAIEGDSIRVKVPVDAETRSVILDFAAVGSTTTLGAPVHIDAPDEIVDDTADTVIIDYIISTAGNYYPVIVLCSGIEADVATTPKSCNPSAGYVEDTSDVIADNNFVRVIVLDSTPTAPVLLDPAVDATGAISSCVGINSISIEAP